MKDSNEYDKRLLTDISNHITIDGGASLVRNLKDYPPRKMEQLLKKASTTKLLAFLEQYPHVFSVDRNHDPHFVYLVSEDYIDRSHIRYISNGPMKRDLEDRIVYMMKKQESKEKRRNKSQAPSGVRNDWLLKQCKTVCHFYLRESGFYDRIYPDASQVKIVGSTEWMDLVLHEFMSVVSNVASVDKERIYLRQEVESELDDTLYISQRLVEAVKQDGGTHISLSLLLHRYPELKPILTGRDVVQLKQDHSGTFKDINVFKKNNEIYVHNTIQREGRMLVDETGLFSVASSKWSNALSSIMANACSSVLSVAPSETIAIDLTASVGGITLSLSKRFQKVLAIEIDHHRANLCNQNMKNHNRGNVIVRCEDSVNAIPSIGNEYQSHPKVIVVDPPWGGYFYKHEKDCEIKMGEWTMSEVVKRISTHLSPTVIGFRMPTEYDAEGMIREVDKTGTFCDVIEIRKVGPQLFIILSV
jgi:predicted RNA methylase